MPKINPQSKPENVQALKTDPENPHLLKNLAEIYRNLGELKQAQHYAQLALSHERNQVDALFISGAVYIAQGDEHKAIEQFARLVTINPDDAEAHNELGNLMCLTGEQQNAIKHYRHALSHQPEFIDCRINLADTLLETDDLEAAIEQYQQVLEVQPHNARVHNQLGQAFESQGNLDQAMTCFEVALEQNPLLIQARLNLGKITIESDPRQAENWFKSVLDIDPKTVEGYYWLGILFQTMGKFERATNYLIQASRLDPGFAFTWYRLSLDRNFQPTDAQLEMLEQQLASKSTPVHDDDQRVALEFSLARFQEQRGNHATAFRHFQQGNSLKAAKNHFDRPNHESQIDNVIDTFDAEFFNQRQDWGSQSTLPVFIIGMPRSGTSLVEQTLSAHPLMHGAGELRLMPELASSLKQDSTAPTNSHAQRVASLKRQQVHELAQQQLEIIRNLQPLARHVIDKLPGNYFRLGLIRLLFPRAIIIHCHRDPMDTCWSCYQQNFDQGLNFTNDLETLGHAYRGYQRLMAHWHEVLPGQIHDIGYEELVQNPEFVSRKLLQHCGVEWHPGVLDYQQQQRPVTTASMWQLRQPLYQTSIGRWKTYRQYLHPLSHVLSSADQHSPAGD